MSVMAVARFERFFRLAAGLDFDKNDIKKFDDLAEEQLLVGGLGIAVARTMKIVEPGLVNPSTQDWDRARQLLDVLL